jgi:rhamnogalacturonan endolyase
MFLRSAILAAAAFSCSTLAAFGITTSGDNIIVDAGSSNTLRVSVNSKSCDINSILYRGEELQSKGKGSQISSGLGTATVKSEMISGK